MSHPQAVHHSRALAPADAGRRRKAEAAQRRLRAEAAAARRSISTNIATRISRRAA